MLHYAQDLAASPPVLYKFMVGRRAAPPFLIFGPPPQSLSNARPAALTRHRPAAAVHERGLAEPAEGG